MESSNLDIIINQNMPEGARPMSVSAPGDINRKVVDILSEKVTPEEIGDTIQGMRTATRTTKYGNEPDYRAREAGVKLWLAYRVGLPVQRQEIVSVNLDAESEIGVKDRFKNSPALRKSIRKILDELDEEEGTVG